MADEVQLMRLHPKIRQIIEQNSVISRSGWIDQHQGIDAILEEVNKILKTLIPPILVLRSVTGSNRLDPDNFFFSDIRIIRFLSG